MTFCQGYIKLSYFLLYTKAVNDDMDLKSGFDSNVCNVNTPNLLDWQCEGDTIS